MKSKAYQDWFERHGEEQLLTWPLTEKGKDYELLVAKSGNAWIIDISKLKCEGLDGVIKRIFLEGAEKYAKIVHLSDLALTYAGDLAYHVRTLGLDADDALVTAYETKFIEEIFKG